MTTANENTNHGCCGGHGHGHGHHGADASLEQRDLGLKDVHATDAQCGCEPGQCECGRHETCDCATSECECDCKEGKGHGHCGDHGHAHHGQSAAAQGGVPDHGDCECKQCEDADKEADKEAAREAAEKQDGAGGCGCGCGHGGHGGGAEAEDFTDPDTVNEDGTNPAVRTVDKPETYDENARWNDGN